MNNPFEIIDARLSNIEDLLLDLKHKPKNASDPHIEDELLTIKQAATFLNLSTSTLYGYVHQTFIPVCKRARRLFFSKMDLIDWVKAGRKKTISESITELGQQKNHLVKKKGGKYE